MLGQRADTSLVWGNGDESPSREALFSVPPLVRAPAQHRVLSPSVVTWVSQRAWWGCSVRVSGLDTRLWAFVPGGFGISFPVSSVLSFAHCLVDSELHQYLGVSSVTEDVDSGSHGPAGFRSTRDFCREEVFCSLWSNLSTYSFVALGF